MLFLLCLSMTLVPGWSCSCNFLAGDNDSEALMNLCHWVNSKINYLSVMYTFSDYIWLCDYTVVA